MKMVKWAKITRQKRFIKELQQESKWKRNRKIKKTKHKQRINIFNFKLKYEELEG